MKSNLSRKRRQKLNIIRNLRKQADGLYQRIREVCPEKYQNERPNGDDMLGCDWFDACNAAFDLWDAIDDLEMELDPNALLDDDI